MFRRLLTRTLLPACTPHLRAAAAAGHTPRAAAHTPTPALASPSREFSISAARAIKSETHFPKDLYDSIAEGTLDGILMSLEQLSEQRADIDVDYSEQAGVLTLTTPQGTYVINKQPPNRQLWLSSPVSGPFRYEWDHARMLWVSAKGDGTTLSGVLRKEVGIEYDISLPIAG